MAKKGLLGKLITMAAAAAAIGGACYAFRDKIKASKLYEELGVDDKLHSLKELLKREKDEEDFFEEDEYIFDTENDDSNRNYVSIHTEASPEKELKEDTRVTPAAYAGAKDTSDTQETAAGKKDAEESAGQKAEDAVPTITMDMLSDSAISENSFAGAHTTAAVNSSAGADTISFKSSSDASESSSADSDASGQEDETPTGYDMEGLSDVSEDPDVLMEQDLLEASPFEFY